MPLVSGMLSARAPSDSFSLQFVVEGAGQGGAVNGWRVVDKDQFAMPGTGGRYFIIAISDSAVRQRISRDLTEAGCVPFSFIANNSLALQNCTIGDGAIICPFSTISSNTVIGRHFHANFYSYIAHDCIIGDFVTFAPKVCCNGNVIIGDFAYIGAGATIRNGKAGAPIRIGTGAIVGMGAVVTRSVPPHAIVVGNPARPLRPKRQ